MNGFRNIPLDDLREHLDELERDKPILSLIHISGTTDAAVEKHVPVWTVENGIVHVKVGSMEHPMLPEHYIEWVSLHTKQGNQRKELHPGEKPEVCFALCEGDKVEAVYAYCNLHSLWKA